MTVITDVPQSGIYFQAGSIVQIIAQIIDVNTGLPVQLQTATGLTISLLYPDNVVSQSFPAQLLTDGSDGMIVYTTVNNGSQVDLSQIGLYKLQGSAAIGGQITLLSYETDFYVLPNTFGGPVMPIVTPTGVVLFDSSNVRWVGTIVGGQLIWAQQLSGPTNFLQFNQLIMKDDTGTYWTYSISTVGVVSAVPGGTFPNAINQFVLADANNKSWIITGTEAGTLLPS